MNEQANALRSQLLEASVARLDFAFCYYSDTTHVDGLRAFDTDGLEVKLNNDLLGALLSGHDGLRNFAWYEARLQNGETYGVYSWLVASDVLIRAGEYQLTNPFERDGSDALYYRSGDPQTFISTTSWTSAESPEVIEAIPDNPDVFSRRALAQNPYTPTHLIARLAGDADELTRTHARAHRFLSKRTVKAVENDLGMAFTPYLEPELLEILAASQWSIVRQAVAQHPQLPHTSLERLAVDPIPQVRVSVLGSPNVSEALKLHLIDNLKNLPGNVREDIAADDTTPRLALELLSADWLMPVRMAVIQNTMTTTPILMRFSLCCDAELRLELLRLHDDNPEVVSALLGDPDERIRNDAKTAFAKLPNAEAFRPTYPASDETLDEFEFLARSPYAWERVQAIKKAKVQKDLERFVGDPHGEVRLGLFWHPNGLGLSMNQSPWARFVLERFSQDPEHWIRSQVALLVRDPKVMEQMSNDPDLGVLKMLEINPHIPADIRERLLQRLRKFDGD